MGRLLDADASVLAVIDVQDGFLRKLPEEEAAQLVDRIAWLCRLAGRLGVPVVVTEEAPERNGETAPSIREALPPGTVRHPKPVFDLSACRPILEDVARHGRGTVVLCGLETDVCVAQSALGLLDRGRRVAVVEDAVASPGAAHAQGLARMSGAGVELVGLKGLAYEWARTVERSQELSDPPAGILL
ncbi:MAG TPA: isochorismatase family protein [Gaiellaceae bacterium]|nr:isochorismatase family protein [Gaiellaceae bacterium]